MKLKSFTAAIAGNKIIISKHPLIKNHEENILNIF